MDNIWKLTKPNDLIIALMENLDKKTQYGENLDILSKPERVFYIAQTLEMEVNNGGFSQFFYNSSGNFSNELVNVFTEIGANVTSKICEKAILAFGQELPTDRDEREQILDELESDEIDEILEECDSAFYNYEDDLNTLNYEYVLKNKEYFK